MYLTVCQSCWDGEHAGCEGGQCQCPAEAAHHGQHEPYEED